MDKFVMFDGQKYRRHKNGYYFAEHWGKNPNSCLHRAVWEFHNGPIPDGHHVHHKDHDPSNNDISNLELMTIHDHLSYHSKNGGWVGSEANLKQLREAAELSKAWHASPEGREVHRRIGLDAWKDKKTYRVLCQEIDCGVEFDTPFPTRAKFCCGACKERNRLRRLGKELRTRRGYKGMDRSASS